MTPSKKTPHPHFEGFAVSIVATLQEAGFQALFAGGCVRDHLLGCPPKDFDVATNATPQAVSRLFRGFRVIPMGAQFGIIAVGSRERPSELVEVATFRSDGTYSDGRHPDSVRFGTALEDARRRDFTINGLFFDPIADRLIDFVGGRADLERRLIRAIGNASQRLQEDKLRMLRAVRFAAQLDFELEDSTASAIRQMAPEILIVSAERISQELRRMLTAPTRVRAVELLRSTGLWEQILGRWSQDGPGRWDEMIRILSVLEEPSFPICLATLLRGSGQGEEQTLEHAAEVSQRLRMSNEEAQRLFWLLRNESAFLSARDMSWAKLQPLLISTYAREMLGLAEAVATVTQVGQNDVAYCHEKLQAPSEVLDPPALISGHDLMEAGIAKGPVFRELITRVREAQLEQRVHSKEQALELIETWMTKRENGK